MKKTANFKDIITIISIFPALAGRLPLYLPLNIIILRGLIIISLLVLIIG